MNILLCNERFLFRFGVDRVLTLLGFGLKERGHTISVIANRMDVPIVRGFSDNLITVPELEDCYLNLNEFTAHWLEINWDSLFDAQNYPDVVLIGGWPFFSSIPLFERKGCRAVFMDCGAVPLEGFDEGGRITQRKLRELRKLYLPQLTAITPISHFIAKSQSAVDAPGIHIEPILLGADHMTMDIWRSDDINTANKGESANINQFIMERREVGDKIILNLGRWEPGCYKNSEAIFELVDAMSADVPRVVILILADSRTTEIPAGYQNRVIPIGYPDDSALEEVMTQVDLGVSVSRWEGFNLPMAEMQWLNKPVLGFKVGAHSEVSLHPWFLCQDIIEMGNKAVDLLNGRGPDADTRRTSLGRFHAEFRWESVFRRYESFLQTILVRRPSAPINICIDVTNAARDPANSGVIRVTRRLCSELQRFCEPSFVIWDRSALSYVFPTAQEYNQLSAFNGPTISRDMPISIGGKRLLCDDVRTNLDGRPEWLLLIETILEDDGLEIRKFAAERRIRVAAVFHDAIPVLRPDLIKDAVIRNNHSRYMQGLAKCDLVFAVSEYSASCLRKFWEEWNIIGPTVIANPNPGEFFGSERCTVPKDRGESTNILCVSTLEPRKNHRKLIEAVKLFGQRHPDEVWTLTLIGNRYAGGEDIATYVEEACGDARIKWLGVVDDDTLHSAYQDCTFTIYASEIEGFGMPILESIWHGKPCICHEQGVMAELAVEGGCLTVDVTRAEKLARGISELVTNRGLFVKLSNAAIARPIKDWSEYANLLLNRLVEHRGESPSLGTPHSDIGATGAVAGVTTDDSWQSILYPGCLTNEWQMNDSERLGLAAVLQRLQPKCAIEVGTYRGGSLSLIRQFSEVVFSIDIDPSIPAKFGHYNNVSFFTGPSHLILPVLLTELDASEIPVEFILIDGDHSAIGIKRDIDIVLEYVPKKPLIVLMHDGFNPECRRGILEANWQGSSYVHHVDVDFIPGRVVEHGGGGDGEMWGGLAMAYLSPTRRHGEIVVQATAKMTFARTVAWGKDNAHSSML